MTRAIRIHNMDKKASTFDFWSVFLILVASHPEDCCLVLYHWLEQILFAKPSTLILAYATKGMATYIRDECGGAKTNCFCRIGKLKILIDKRKIIFKIVILLT